MKAYFNALFCFFLFSNIQAIKFTSVIDGSQKELPDIITIKNDLDESVVLEGKIRLLDGCFPIGHVVLAAKKEHSLRDVDAWGLFSLDIKTSKQTFGASFPGESIIRSEKDSDVIETIIKVSAIINAIRNRQTQFSSEIIRSPKKS